MLRALHPISDVPPVLVAELIDVPSRKWDRAAVYQHMNVIDVEAVLNISLSTSASEDWWAWLYERSGIFSARSAYHLLVDTKRRREDWLYHHGSMSDMASKQKQWQKLWKANVLGKINFFLGD